MKKVILILIIFGVGVLILPKFVSDTSQLVRGQMRLNLSRELAQYLVDNDCRFPKSWNDYEEYHFVKRFGKANDSKSSSILNNKYLLPWGQSLTNNNVLSSVWFKSIDRKRVAEDKAFTREVLFDVLSISTNKALNETIINALR